MLRRSLAALLLVIAAAAPAAAQVQRPLPKFVFDVRAFYSGLGEDPVTAEGLDVFEEDLPDRGFGAFGGVHFYPWRGKKMAIGIGGEGWFANSSKQPTDEDGNVTAPLIQQQFRGVTPVVSLNFGQGGGWSYLTAGMGPISLVSFLGEETPDAPKPYQMTINMGGGARWFPNQHVAFGFDVRFWLTKPIDPTEFYPGRQRTRLIILSAGVSFK